MREDAPRTVLFFHWGNLAYPPGSPANGLPLFTQLLLPFSVFLPVVHRWGSPSARLTSRRKRSWGAVGRALLVPPPLKAQLFGETCFRTGQRQSALWPLCSQGETTFQGSSKGPEVLRLLIAGSSPKGDISKSLCLRDTVPFTVVTGM